jgi:hypothetical protein
MFVYAMRGGGYAKIGVSDDIEKRLSSFNRGALPFEMTIICLGEADTETALVIEARILGAMPGRLRGEWLDGSVSNAEIVSAFEAWEWTTPILVSPTLEQIAKANRCTAMQRQLEASRAIARTMEAKAPAGVDWRRIATELANRGDRAGVTMVRKAFKAKRLAAQRKVSR